MSRANRGEAPSPPGAEAAETVSEPRIRAAILELTGRRAPATVCPSEVARALAADWRALMPAVRRVAGTLAAEGHVAVTQRGRASDVAAKGPIRLGAAHPPSRPDQR